MTAADAPTAFVVDYDAGLRVSIPKTAEIGAFVEPGWNRSQEGPYGALWEVGGCWLPWCASAGWRWRRVGLLAPLPVRFRTHRAR
jgi:hypothetical protein